MKKILLLQMLFLVFGIAKGQRVGIGTTNPDSSSILDVSSNSKGLLIPRMTTSQRNAIDDPASGLMILNLDDNCIDIYDGANWIKNCGMKITGTDTIPPGWTQMTNIGGVARSGAVGFSINGKGYMGTGLTSGGWVKDFWEYNPDTDVWTQKADFGGTARTDAVGGALYGHGYIATGMDGQYKNDLWKYTPATNSWVQKASLPGSPRQNAFCLVAHGFLTVGTGENNFGLMRDVYSYYDSGDYWIPEPDFPLEASDLIAFTAGGEGFAGVGWMDWIFGEGPHNFLYLLTASNWIQAPQFPGAERYAAVATGIGDKGYVGCGREYNVFRNDFWSFDAETYTWQQLSSCSNTGRADATVFSIGTSIYVAAGLNEYLNQDVWRYDLYPIGNEYSTPELPGPVASVSDGIWTKSVENIFNNSTGNIGLGIDDPKNKIDIKGAGERTGIHPANLPFYVSGLQSANSAGAEFRDNTGAFGIGLGNNSIYAAGSSADHSLSFRAKGSSGHLQYFTNNVERLRITGAGFVGIGHTAPNAPLQFANAPASRKIVLSETVNNIHQFLGFGVETGQLRYQVDAPGTSHVFYAAINGTSSSEIMRMQGDGNVGIGIMGALNKLDIRGPVLRSGTHATGRPLYITGTLNDAANGVEIRHDNGQQGIGIGQNTLYAAGSNTTQNLGLASKGTTGQLLFTTNNTQRMVITGSGNVGIGVTAPNSPLQFASLTATRKIVLFEGVNNDHQFLGFGVETGALKYQIDAPGASHVFSAAVNGTSSTQVMRITGTGFVGIGNVAAPHAPLQFTSMLAPRKIVLFEGVNNDHQFYGFGIYSGELRYQVDAPESNHVFYAAANGTSSTELMRITGNGNVTVAGVIQSEAYMNATLLNSFAQLGGFAAVSYFKDEMGIVHLRGSVDRVGDPDGLTIFTLPVGYRPSSGQLMYGAMNNGAIARVDIFPNGDVKVIFGGTGYISLDGITFRPD